MLRIESKVLLLICIHVVLSVAVLLADLSYLQGNLSYFFTLSFILFLFIGYSKRKPYNFLRPSVIVGLYSSGMFLIGSFFYEMGIVHPSHERGNFYSLEHFELITSFLFLSLAFTALPILFLRSSKRKQSYKPNKSFDKHIIYMLSIFALGIFLSIKKIYFSLGDNVFDISGAIIILSALYLSILASLGQSKLRFLIYFLFSLFLIIFLFDDRRLFVMYLLFVLFLEARILNSISISKIIFNSIGIIIILVSGILIATSYRSPIQTDFRDFISEASTPQLASYFEGASLIFHTYDAISTQISQGEFTLGSTYIKSLFIPIPRDFVQIKPRSFIDLYNSKNFPKYRDVGGSNASHFYAEAFWNFSYLGIVPIFLLLFFFEKVYFKLLNLLYLKRVLPSLFLALIYFRVLEFARGTGIDGIMWPILIGFLFMLPAYLLKFKKFI